MKKTGLAVFFVLVILLGLLAGQLGIAHLPWSSEDADTAPAQAVTEQAAEAPARDGETTAPATIFCLLCDWNASQAMPFQYFAESVNK